MSQPVKIKTEFTKRRMKNGSGEFFAKKTEGGGWYWIKMADGNQYRHLAKVVEELSEEVKCEEKT